MTSKLSIGILGAGFAAKHVQRLLTIDDVTVSAVCATTEANARAFIERMGAKEAAGYGDFDEMLAKTRLDGLYVCIPPHAHNGQVEKAAGRGIHLFLEKPIASDTAGAERQAEAIERAGVVSMVGYHNRFRKSVEIYKGLIDCHVGCVRPGAPGKGIASAQAAQHLFNTPCCRRDHGICGAGPENVRRRSGSLSKRGSL